MVVLGFRAHGSDLFVVDTASVNWKLRVGFKPKQPYLLVDSSGAIINGVTESDLAWYRKTYPTPEAVLYSTPPWIR